MAALKAAANELLYWVCYLIWRMPWWGWLVLLFGLSALSIALDPDCCGPGPVYDLVPVYHY